MFNSPEQWVTAIDLPLPAKQLLLCLAQQGDHYGRCQNISSFKLAKFAELNIFVTIFWLYYLAQRKIIQTSPPYTQLWDFLWPKSYILRLNFDPNVFNLASTLRRSCHVS